ncbi:MAG TPA: hypothetical protein VI306_10065 [Pyrinomonadaceae bacterium]
MSIYFKIPTTTTWAHPTFFIDTRRVTGVSLAHPKHNAVQLQQPNHRLSNRPDGMRVLLLSYRPSTERLVCVT